MSFFGFFVELGEGLACRHIVGFDSIDFCDFVHRL